MHTGFLDESLMPLKEFHCQIRILPAVAEELKRHDIIFQRIRKLRLGMKRRMTFVWNVIKRRIRRGGRRITSIQRESPFQAGDVVMVRSKREILATLDEWNRLNRCSFMEEMWAYCETRQRVLKRVERFLDERDYLVKRTRGVVILENVLCAGTVGFGRCDRTCFFFWREEWLKKVDGSGALHLGEASSRKDQ